MKKKQMRRAIAVLLIIVGMIVPTMLTIMSIKFNQNCEGYLKQAADASTPDLALERINVAVNYIETHGLTDGYTSVMWKTEDENIEFWYTNIINCREELRSCLESSQLEKTNVLMKVRESLSDNGEIIVPEGIYKYPHNCLWAILLTVSIILAMPSCVYFLVSILE